MIEIRSRFVVPRISVVRVPRGDRGTLSTARMIARMIYGGAKDFYVRQKAIQILRNYGVPPKDRLGEVCAIFDWVKRNVRYTRDIFTVELLHSARRMIELQAGDCDDMTILLGAMLMSTGHPVRIALVGFRRDRPHSYSHIYPEVNIHGRWVAIDATMNRPMGWAPPARWKRVCDISRGELRCCSTTR